MATSDKWRLLITANAGNIGQLAIGEWQLRTSPGVSRPFVWKSMTANVLDGGAAALQGAGSLTQYVNTYTYDSWVALTLPFSVNIGGLVTTQVVVNSYGQISFGHDGTTHGWNLYLEQGNSIPFPSIVHGSAEGYGGSAFQNLYAGSEDGGATYRIRLEMFAGWEDPGDGTVNTVWEVTFDSAHPESFRIDFGTSGYAGLEGSAGVTAGVGDGSTPPLVATFTNVLNKQYTVTTSPIAADGVLTASAADSSNPASGAIDGDPDTSWVANGAPSVSAPKWLQYTFAAPQTIREYTIKAPSDSRGNPLDSLPGSWTLQYWDGSAWQAQDTQTGQTGWSYNQERVYAAVPPSNDGDVTLPQLTVDALVGAADSIIGANMAIPVLTLAGTMGREHDGDINLGNPQNLGPLYNATPFTLAATARSGTVLNGDATLGLIDAAGSLEPAAALPLLTLAALGYAGTVSDGKAVLGTLSASAVTGDLLTLAEFMLAATGLAGLVGQGTSVLPRFDGAGAGLAGTVGNGALRLETLDANASTGNAGDIGLAQLAVSADALAGTVANASILFSRPTLDAEGMSDQLPTEGSAQLLPMQLAGSMVGGQVGEGAVLLLPAQVSGSAQGDAILSGALTFSYPQLDATGLAGELADGAVTLSPWLLAASGSAPLPDNNGAGAAQLGTLQSAGVLLAGRMADGAGIVAAPTLLATLVSDQIADGALPLRAPSLAASGISNPAPGEATAALSMAALTVAASATAGTMSSGAVQLPRLLADAELLGERISAGASVLPALLLGGSMVESAAAPANGGVNWPVLQLAGAMFGDTTADASLPLPRIAVAGMMPPELIGGAAAVLPALHLAASMFEGAAAPAAAGAALPAFRLDAILAAGGMADGAALLRAPVVVAEAYASTEASADLRLPQPSLTARATADILIEGAAVLPQLQADGNQAATIEGAATLRLLDLAASGSAVAVIHGDVHLAPIAANAGSVAGNIAMASITVPLLLVGANGHADTVGSATIAVPLLEMGVSALAVATVPGPVFTGVAVNTRTRAASTYAGLDFNSVATFNGMVLAATADGIVALTGDTDGGRPIAASLAAGVSGFGSEQFKRVLCGYAGYSATGELELTMITDTHHEYVYALLPRQIDELHAARVKFGRGVEGRYWQWKLANRAGAGFALDALTLDVSPLSRRT